MSTKRAFTTCLAALLCLASALHSQIRSAIITGSVTDSTGAVVPNALVRITNEETAINNSTKTNEAGLFTVPYLPAGKTPSRSISPVLRPTVKRVSRWKRRRRCASA